MGYVWGETQILIFVISTPWRRQDFHAYHLHMIQVHSCKIIPVSINLSKIGINLTYVLVASLTNKEKVDNNINNIVQNFAI